MATSASPTEGASSEASSSGTFSSGPDQFTFYDVFFWRDAPDWYRKTFHATGFGLAFCTLKQYMNRHQLEVFMPPRSKVLPEKLRSGYINSQMLKYGFLRVGKEATVIAGVSATLYGGAYYLGEYRGEHTWENFAASGAAAGVGAALWLLRPLHVRPMLFGAAFGALMGSFYGQAMRLTGLPYWEEGHDFEGYFFGNKINLKAKTQDAEKKDA